MSLAVNSQHDRSQDQLHIHVDCIKPQVRDLLRKHVDEIGYSWSLPPFAVDGKKYNARRLDDPNLSHTNPVALISDELPKRPPTWGRKRMSWPEPKLAMGRTDLYCLRIERVGRRWTMPMAKIFKITRAGGSLSGCVTRSRTGERDRDVCHSGAAAQGLKELAGQAPRGGPRAYPPTSIVRDVGAKLFQLIRHLVDARLGAGLVLVPAGAPETPTAAITASPTLIGSAPCAGIILVRNGAPAFGLSLTAARIRRMACERCARYRPSSGVFEGMRRGAVAANGDKRLSFQPDDGHRHMVALLRARLIGALRDGERERGG